MGIELGSWERLGCRALNERAFRDGTVLQSVSKRFSIVFRTIVERIKSMPLSEENIPLAFRTAIPIDDIDRFITPERKIMAVVWLDLQDRPDMHYLAERHQGGQGGYAVCTWFYGNVGQKSMVIGLYVEMREPTRTAFSIVMRPKEYEEQLDAIARDGQLWLVPGPPPAHLVGTIEMTYQEFMDKVVAFSGEGVHIELQDHLRAELAARLAEWKRAK